jgi:hypothetical protein
VSSSQAGRARSVLITHYPLRTGNSLASTYLAAGRLAQAILLCERTLAFCIRVLGDDHALTGNVCRNLNMAQERTAN